MAQVTVTINGKNYRMACDDGEEDRLKELAGNFDDYVTQLREQFGEIGDLRLTVMAGLMVADALGESERRAAELQQELGRFAPDPRRGGRPESQRTTAIGRQAEHRRGAHRGHYQDDEPGIVCRWQGAMTGNCRPPRLYVPPARLSFA